MFDRYHGRWIDMMDGWEIYRSSLYSTNEHPISSSRYACNDVWRTVRLSSNAPRYSGREDTLHHQRVSGRECCNYSEASICLLGVMFMLETWSISARTLSAFDFRCQSQRSHGCRSVSAGPHAHACCYFPALTRRAFGIEIHGCLARCSSVRVSGR